MDKVLGLYTSVYAIHIHTLIYTQLPWLLAVCSVDVCGITDHLHFRMLKAISVNLTPHTQIKTYHTHTIWITLMTLLPSRTQCKRNFQEHINVCQKMSSVFSTLKSDYMEMQGFRPAAVSFKKYVHTNTHIHTQSLSELYLKLNPGYENRSEVSSSGKYIDKREKGGRVHDLFPPCPLPCWFSVSLPAVFVFFLLPQPAPQFPSLLSIILYWTSFGRLDVDVLTWD